MSIWSYSFRLSVFW